MHCLLVYTTDAFYTKEREIVSISTPTTAKTCVRRKYTCFVSFSEMSNAILLIEIGSEFMRLV